MKRFIFDLDGTISAEETLPLLAAHFHIEEDIARLTRETVAGTLPFTESFIMRVRLLSHLPVSEIRALLERVRLFPALLDFIAAHAAQCVVATGNLDCWVGGLLDRIGVESYASSALVENDRVVKISTILQKEDVVRRFKERGDTVIFIGEGNNDVEAMRQADISVASGLVHAPASSVLNVADYLALEEGTLCRLLDQLC